MISAQKPETIRSMFDGIARRYDLANTVLSLGTHRLWKQKLVARASLGLHPRSVVRVLDCATGTGDIAELWAKQLAKGDASSGSEVVATDFSEGMLEQARKRFSQRRSSVSVPIHFQWADVQQLQFADEVFDRATISFGIRNVADPVKGLSELGRVVKRGGEVWVLEFGQPTLPGFVSVYGWYSGRVLPVIGGWLSGARGAYRYLHESSAQFPSGEEFLNLARKTGYFSHCDAFPLTGGVAYLYRLRRS